MKTGARLLVASFAVALLGQLPPKDMALIDKANPLCGRLNRGGL